MQIPKRTYHYQPKPKPLEKALKTRIEDLCLQYPRYGYRRVTKQLHREGIIVNHKKVARIMRENGWSCRRAKRKWTCTTDSNHSYRIYPNLVKEMTIDRINQLWVADITYIHILVCFIYLAVIMDVFSRKAIGYAISRNIDTELTMQALRMAIYTRNPPAGCIHHSDRGIQYASNDYVKELKLHGFAISMSRKGNPYDNAFAESFFKTLKSEEVYMWEYRTMADVQRRIPYFIEEVYNQKRLHSAIGYRPPCEYEMLMLNQDPNQTALTVHI